MVLDQWFLTFQHHLSILNVLILNIIFNLSGYKNVLNIIFHIFLWLSF